MKYPKDIKEHLKNRSVVSKRIQKAFGILIALVFMTSTIETQAKSINEGFKPHCFQTCDAMADVIGDHYELDHYAEYLVFEGCMSTCKDAGVLISE